MTRSILSVERFCRKRKNIFIPMRLLLTLIGISLSIMNGLNFTSPNVSFSKELANI